MTREFCFRANFNFMLPAKPPLHVLYLSRPEAPSRPVHDPNRANTPVFRENQCVNSAFL